MPSHAHASSTLLVIEDNPTQLETLTDILEADGLKPIGCLSGKAALEACQHQNVHVAILDLRLPDMDGLSVLQQLKEHVPDMAVIINTAYASLESAITALNRDAFAYVQKMGDPDELLGHVHRAFHAHLAGYSARLEREVGARTVALAQANSALQQEIAERRQAEEQLTSALQYKNALLQEVQHRTRNNMQMLSSLMSFQARYTEDAQVHRILSALQHRIEAMALVHEKLFRNDLMTVDLREYIEALARTLMYMHAVRPDRIALTYEIDAACMTIDPAVSFGLLLHEVLANALRHAFPNDQSGNIQMSFHRAMDDQWELRVRDTGVGLPAGFDARNPATLGFQLIAILTQHLQGTLAVQRHTPGTEVIIRFKEQEYAKRI